jgi:hypothetical protein
MRRMKADTPRVIARDVLTVAVILFVLWLIGLAARFAYS